MAKALIERAFAIYIVNQDLIKSHYVLRKQNVISGLRSRTQPICHSLAMSTTKGHGYPLRSLHYLDL